MQPLMTWVQPSFAVGEDFGGVHFRQEELYQLQIDLKLSLPWGSGASQAYEALWQQFESDPELFLTVIDWCLHRCSFQRARDLERILNDGSSAYKVSATADSVWELQDRVSPTIALSALESATPGSAAEHHLSLAWSHTYGQHKNPGASYGESIKAVECVAIPVVIPNNPVGTLGQVIAAMAEKPSKWETSLKPPPGVDAIENIIGMLRLLWRSQKDRHGVPDPARPVVISQPEAEAAVHLAATLVHWFDSRAVRLVKP